MQFLQDGLQELRKVEAQKTVRRGAEGKEGVSQLNQTQMKGTMHIGELWGNQDVMKYLRENKIRMTKVKLLDRFQAIKKEADQAKKED